jgi:hypothetical protein
MRCHLSPSHSKVLPRSHCAVRVSIHGAVSVARSVAPRTLHTVSSQSLTPRYAAQKERPSFAARNNRVVLSQSLLTCINLFVSFLPRCLCCVSEAHSASFRGCPTKRNPGQKTAKRRTRHNTRHEWEKQTPRMVERKKANDRTAFLEGNAREAKYSIKNMGGFELNHCTVKTPSEPVRVTPSIRSLVRQERQRVQAAVTHAAVAGESSSTLEVDIQKLGIAYNHGRTSRWEMHRCLAAPEPW